MRRRRYVWIATVLVAIVFAFNLGAMTFGFRPDLADWITFGLEATGIAAIWANEWRLAVNRCRIIRQRANPTKKEN